MQYRREIDGLRAVAVLPVILFHAGFKIFSGGFVGVDVFFVISGYLITSILSAELSQDNFSIIRFYERRARRILPALFFVMLACLPFAYLWMLQSQLNDFAKSIVAVVSFSSNILFWRSDGYFAAAAELKPLLHTWSLAVEEQYYLIFPVFLLLIWRFGRNRVFLVVLIITIVSFLLSEWGWRYMPTANFYLAPSRAWELLVGSLCAFLTVGWSPKSNNFLSTSGQTYLTAGQSHQLKNILSASGLALIIFAILSYDKSTPFPSAYALAPVIGTALIILFAEQGTWVSSMLSTKPFVGLGLISYSAYLWHQPLFSFARLRSFPEPSNSLMLGLSLVTLVLAWATWRFVEQPFRKGSNSIFVKQRIFFTASCAVAALFLAISLVVNYKDGFPQRFNISDAVLSDMSVRELQAPCSDFDHLQVASAVDWFCVEGETNHYSATVAVVGDSHAISYFGPLNAWGKKNGVRVLLNSVSGCPPLIDTYVRRFDSRRDDCAARNAQVFSRNALADVDLLILIGRWTYYGFGDVNGEVKYVGLNYYVEANKESSYNTFKLQFSKTLNVLASMGVPVVIVHQPPVQINNAISVLQQAAITNSSLDDLSSRGSLSISKHLASYGNLQREMDAIIDNVEHSEFYKIDVASIVCDPLCQMSRKGRMVYLDDNHLSNFGADLVTPAIAAAIKSALKSKLRSGVD